MFDIQDRHVHCSIMRKGRNVDVISKTSYVLEEPPAGLPWVWRVAAEHWSSRFYHPRQNKGSLLLAYIQEGSMAVTEGVSRFEAGPGSVVFVSNAHTVTAQRPTRRLPHSNPRSPARLSRPPSAIGVTPALGPV